MPEQENRVRIQAMVEPEVAARIRWFAKSLKMSTSAFAALVLEMYCDEDDRIVDYAEAVKVRAEETFQQAVDEYERKRELRVEEAEHRASPEGQWEEYERKKRREAGKAMCKAGKKRKKNAK